jgi:hypothetical protein
MAVNQLNRAFARAAADTSESAAHAAVTITARMPVLTAGILMPSAAGYAAWNEAYTEKVEAMWLGVFAASAAWGAAMTRAALAPPTPLGFANEIMKIATIAAKPSRRTAKANAKRYAKG